ncbi:MAG TPA: MFS transporter [Methanocorpusculum sp.]|nr:MFS transporter [Methanocorpusculum sp.]HJJ75132.1 MFS transporter [Methanocorpusculum sp.]HJJ76140.1 MFS transporter [Methanocorpusculum sp.]
MNPQKYLPQWVIILLIVILSTIPPFSTDMFLPALPEMVQSFGTTEAVLNITLYGFMFFQAVFMLLLGPISDKYGRKPILTVSIIIYIITSLLASVAPTIETFILCRMIQGASSGGMMVISIALIKDCFEERIRNTVLTLTVVLGVVGPVASPILGAYIIEAINWQSTLAFPGLLTIICLIITLLFSESLPAEEKLTGNLPSVYKRMAGVCRHKSFMTFLFAMGIFSLPFMAYLAVSSYIFVEGFGIAGTTYSYMLAVNAILGTLGMLLLQRLTKGRSNKTMGVIVIIFAFVSSFILLGAGHLNAAVCFIGTTFMVISAFAARPYALGILMSQFDGDTGSVSSVFNFTLVFIGCLGMAAGTLPWPTYITGLGTCCLFAGVLGALLMYATVKAKVPLKGL